MCQKYIDTAIQYNFYCGVPKLIVFPEIFGIFCFKGTYESANDLQADMDQHNRNARSNRTSYLLLLDIFKIFLLD